MIYTNSSANKNVVTFLSESFKDFYGERYNEINLTEEGMSSKSLLNCSVDGIMDELVFYPRGHLRIFVNNERCYITDNYSYNYYDFEGKVTLFLKEKGFLMILHNTRDSGRVETGDVYFFSSPTDKGQLFFTLSELFNEYSADYSPVLITHENETIYLDNPRPVNFSSNFYESTGKGAYYTAPLQFFTKEKGVITTDIKAIAADLDYFRTEKKILIPPFLADTNRRFIIPMSLLFL